MKQTTQWNDHEERDLPGAQPPRRLTFLKFFMRYPIFILGFGPPLFRSAGVDATKGNLDAWSFLQVGMLLAVVAHALLRLAYAESIFMPKQIRLILNLTLVLNFLFLASAAYSPSQFVSAFYAIVDILILVCVAQFIADVYKDPPDWMQCLFQLRSMAFLQLGLVLITLAFKPSSVVVIEPGVGVRLYGGGVAPVALICPLIAIISAYTFLYSLESRSKSSLFFMVGLAGTLITQSRGGEIALIISLALVIAGWAKMNRRTAYIFISGIMAFTLLFGTVVATIGIERIWQIVNRGESAEGIASASGRTDIWKFVIHYCMGHPLGMGYIAGFRILFRSYFSLGSSLKTSHIGNTHNAFMEVLAGAGWPALALYLLIMAMIVFRGMRSVIKPAFSSITFDSAAYHANRCTLALLVCCFAGGMSDADFAVPMRVAFYLQNIIIAIILGISGRMIAVYRSRRSDDLRKVSYGMIP
ncbi:MAG: O-antigen ligase family protein [Terracidiphilus sp.]|jgi:O-antigen ligase